MGRIATTEATNPFGEWLEEMMQDLGLNRKTLAAHAGVGTSSVSNWIAGHRSPKRKSVEKLVGNLAPDPEARGKLLGKALAAAGFNDPSDESCDPISTITREAGYDPAEFDAEDLDQLRRGVRAFTQSWLQDKRRREGRDN